LIVMTVTGPSFATNSVGSSVMLDQPPQVSES
jgi:hypothetical protein